MKKITLRNLICFLQLLFAIPTILCAGGILILMWIYASSNSDITYYMPLTLIACLTILCFGIVAIVFTIKLKKTSIAQADDSICKKDVLANIALIISNFVVILSVELFYFIDVKVAGYPISDIILINLPLVPPLTVIILAIITLRINYLKSNPPTKKNHV